MGRSDKRLKKNSESRNWLLILAAIIPVWAIVMFVGWFAISTLVPMLGTDQTDQIANDPSKAIIDFSTAAGGKDGDQK